jgi:hypothetical protein
MTVRASVSLRFSRESYRSVVMIVADCFVGPDFAKLVANELLERFSSNFRAELEHKITSLDTYASFNSEIGECIRNSVGVPDRHE